jgi:hypothetical protein
MQAADLFLFPQGVASRGNGLRPTLCDHSRSVDVGVLGMPATLADELGLRGPVVRVSVAAGRTLLRAMVGWHFDAQLACCQRLVLGEQFRVAPGVCAEIRSKRHAERFEDPALGVCNPISLEGKNGHHMNGRLFPEFEYGSTTPYKFSYAMVTTVPSPRVNTIGAVPHFSRSISRSSPPCFPAKEHLDAESVSNRLHI